MVIKLGEYTWKIVEDGREYLIGDVRKVVTAVLDLSDGKSVTLLLSNSSQPIAIYFEKKEGATKFFHEVSNEVFHYQRVVASKALCKEYEAVAGVG